MRPFSTGARSSFRPAFTVVLEAYLLHTRNLLEFFAGDKRRAGDVFAFHFIDGGEQAWVAVCSEQDIETLLGKSIADVHKRISNSIGHIGTARIEKAAWNPLVIANGLGQVYLRFIGAMTPGVSAGIERWLPRELHTAKLWQPIRSVDQ